MEHNYFSGLEQISEPLCSRISVDRKRKPLSVRMIRIFVLSPQETISQRNLFRSDTWREWNLFFWSADRNCVQASAIVSTTRIFSVSIYSRMLAPAWDGFLFALCQRFGFCHCRWRALFWINRLLEIVVPCKVSRGQETWVQKLKSALLVVRMRARELCTPFSSLKPW